MSSPRTARPSRPTRNTSAARAIARTFPMTDADLAAIQTLVDKEAIRDCVNRYARGIDRHDEDILRSVFHADAVDNHGSVVLGREAFVKWANEWHDNVATRHMHAMTSHISDIAGNEAHAVTYVLF